MIIGIDASRSIDTIQKTGVEKVSDELLAQFFELKSPASPAGRQNSKVKTNDFNFIFYTPGKIDWLPKESQKILQWPFKFLWTQLRLAFELIFHPPDVVFFPVHSMPFILSIFCHPHESLTCRQTDRNSKNNKKELDPRFSLLSPGDDNKKTNYYRIIHDIAFKKQPQLYSWKQRLILNLDLWLSLKLCTKIFVPSEAVKKDIITNCHSLLNGQSGNKIIVTHWGYSPMNNKQPITQNKKKQILYLGRIEEKKNITNLIKAFEIFHSTHPDYRLTLAGKRGDWIPDRVGNDNDNDWLEFLDYVSEEKKYELLRQSAALVLVSKEEGFGLPLLEAFDFGLAVIASDISVLREVGGEACLYVNPNSPEDIAQGLENVVSNENLQSQLIALGHKQLNNFTWLKTAEKILEIIINNK